MDLVITYVNGLDPVWQKEYERYMNVPILEKRFRNWGTLPYLLRGVEANMPFIRQVFLVVSHESQVPEWVNRQQVKVVLHSDIIPPEYLPTFNCNPIEMHLHRIAGLSEKYLYFNDDMFPMMPCRESDFFREGKVVMGMSKHIFTWDMYKKICKNSDKVARRALGMSPSCFFLRPQHICSPMLKSVCEEVYNKVKPEIIASLSPIRMAGNLNQYLYLDYMYLKGLVVNKRISKKHFSLGLASANDMGNFILHPTRKLVCINDVQLSEERYDELHSAQISAFEKRFPNQSKYEL